MDRLVQASLVLVLEPIFEADFKPVSYGFRPRRRAHDAIAEIHHYSSGTCKYYWVFEADIKACFDELSHCAITERVRSRVGDKRVLALIKSFLKSGIMSGGLVRYADTGTPQGGIVSPLLANVALSALDEHFCAKWDAHGSENRRRRAPQARRSHLPDCPLCGRLRDHGAWLQGACGGAVGRGHRRAGPARGCDCRRPRRGSATWTRGSTSWGSASSGGPRGEPPRSMSTPTRRRRRWPRSWIRCGR